MKSAKSQQGFGLVEVIVSIALVLVFIVGGYQGYAALYTSIAYSHYRMTASDLANEYFETIKNLPYASIGIAGGDPSGVLSASQIMSRGGVNYAVETIVQNVNDSFDGSAGDVFPNDYKKIEVSIACEGCLDFAPIVITGQVAPANLES
jgi:prepilin-type N-terminal cleavage/methylation domain-containing protein